MAAVPIAGPADHDRRQSSAPVLPLETSRYRPAPVSFRILHTFSGVIGMSMCGRLEQRVAQEEDFTNHVLMHAMGANTGQRGSVIAGGVLLALVSNVLG